MPEPRGTAREEQFLGGLLGMAIGDALGTSLLGLDQDEITARLINGVAYQTRMGPDGETGDVGHISDRTEQALCLVESLTTNEGRLDPANINARFGFLASGPSRENLSDSMIRGISVAEEQGGLVPADYSSDLDSVIAVRGVPVGLLHSVGALDAAALGRDVETATNLTHRRDRAHAIVAAVSNLVMEAGRGGAETRSDIDVSLPDDLIAALDVSMRAKTFTQGLGEILAKGGDLSTLGAIGGALLGTRLGASALPQSLIDGLDARIYLSMAAPWFYRSAIRRGGSVIDLRPIV